MMDLTKQSGQTLDHRFFQLTGLVMVLGTLMAGTIMLWLANDMEKPSNIVISTMNFEPTPLQAPESAAASRVGQPNASLSLNEMVYVPH